MNYCPNCGKSLTEGMKYCPYCGCQLSGNDAEMQGGAEMTPQSRPAKKASRGKILAAVIAVALAIPLCFVIYLKTRPFSKSPKAIDSALQSVVMISCYDAFGELISTGSGFLAFDKQTIITNNHVLNSAFSVKVSTEQDFTYDVSSVLAYDSAKDIAILKTDEALDVPPLKIGSSEKVKKGETVTAIGSPLGLKNTVSTGVLSGRERIYSVGIDELRFTAAISSGSSGGALFNESGEIIGVTYASYVDGQNLNCAIPIEVVTAIHDGMPDRPLTVEEYCEKEAPQLYYTSKSEYVSLNEIILDPDKYDGRIITTGGYIINRYDPEKYEDFQELYITSMLNRNSYTRPADHPIMPGREEFLYRRLMALSGGIRETRVLICTPVYYDDVSHIEDDYSAAAIGDYVEVTGVFNGERGIIEMYTVFLSQK
jgi:hypothetical protein